MSTSQTAVDDGMIGRLVTRLRDEAPKIDSATVERALQAKRAAQVSRRNALSVAACSAERASVQAVMDAQNTRDEAEAHWPYAGLAPMTRVRTSFGDVFAQALRKGDLIKTRSGEFKPIVWLDRIMLDDRFLLDMKDANPVMLPAGSVGRSIPKADVMVSPRQIVAEQSDFRAAREAGDLLGRPKVRRKMESGMSYTMFHLGQTEEVNCEGLWLRIEV